MTDTTSPALQTALAYYQAWTSHDLDKAMSYIADDIVCDLPGGRLEGADAYRGFLGPLGSRRRVRDRHGRQDHQKPARLRPGPVRRRPESRELTAARVPQAAMTPAQVTGVIATQRLWVPRTSSMSCDQPVFVDHATDASVPSDAVLLKVGPFG